MPMQLITPEGFTLLNGGPKFRRAFLDWGCFHNEPGFFTAWSNLKRLLKQRNAALAAEVEDLKSGEAAVEDRARSELGMIKPGETFYRVVEPQGSAVGAEQAPMDPVGEESDAPAADGEGGDAP